MKNDDTNSHYKEYVKVDHIKQEPNFEDQDHQNIDTIKDNLDSDMLPDDQETYLEKYEEEDTLTEKDFTCDSCFPHVMFLSQKELTNHKKSVHNINVRGRGRPKSLPEDCKCNTCGKTMTDKTKMRDEFEKN